MNTKERVEKLKGSDIKASDLIGGVVKFGNKTYYKVHDKETSPQGIVTVVELEDVVSKARIDYAMATLLYMIDIKEFKVFLPGDDSWKANFKLNEENNLILTAIILNNVAIKGNENLSGTKYYDKYLRNTLEKANKALERKINKYAKELYTADQNVLNDMFFSIEHLAEKIAGTLPRDHNKLHQLVDRFYSLDVNDIDVKFERVEPNA